jgi:hypothetical protein
MGMSRWASGPRASAARSMAVGSPPLIRRVDVARAKGDAQVAGLEEGADPVGQIAPARGPHDRSAGIGAAYGVDDELTGHSRAGILPRAVDVGDDDEIGVAERPAELGREIGRA